MNPHAIDGPSWVFAFALAFIGLYTAVSGVRGRGAGRTFTVLVGAACIWVAVAVLLISAVRNT